MLVVDGISKIVRLGFLVHKKWKYYSLPNFKNPNKTDSTEIPEKTKRIDVEVYCKDRTRCGFLASIQCRPNDTCDEAPTGSKGWTCYVLNDRQLSIAWYTGKTIIRGYQGQEGYPAFSDVNEKARYIWNSEARDVIHCEHEM